MYVIHDGLKPNTIQCQSVSMQKHFKIQSDVLILPCVVQSGTHFSKAAQRFQSASGLVASKCCSGSIIHLLGDVGCLWGLCISCCISVRMCIKAGSAVHVLRRVHLTAGLTDFHVVKVRVDLHFGYLLQGLFLQDVVSGLSQW